MLSLVVIALNESDRIGACLDSVPFADERIVLDSGSTDDTVAVARRHGATVLQTDWPGHVAQKNRALRAAKGEWVLSLDADERLSEEAAASVRSAVSRADADGYALARCSTWLGREIRHGRWYPDRKVRLVRRERAEWVGDDPHDRLVVRGRVRRLEGDILHVPFRDLSDHLGTIGVYSRRHAETLHARGVRGRWVDVVARPPLHFVDAFLLRRGFLDGVPGFVLAGLGSTHVLCKWTLLWNRGRKP